MPLTQRLGTVATGAAIIIIAAWLALLGCMAYMARDDWSRLTTVLSSLQSVAFAAAGALFGVAVQQKRVDDARQVAADAIRASRLAVVRAKSEAATTPPARAS